MSKVLSKDGTPIAFAKSGDGEPIILVDGALCSRSFGPMPKLAPLPAPHFTVLNYDRRGRGESGDTKPYAVEREMEDIEALIGEAGGSASVFGISSGGALALAAAASGLNIKKLALYEPPFVAGRRDHGPPADSEAQLRRLVAEGRRADAVQLLHRGYGGNAGDFRVFHANFTDLAETQGGCAHAALRCRGAGGFLAGASPQIHPRARIRGCRMSLDWTQGDLRVRGTVAPRRPAMIPDPRPRNGRQMVSSWCRTLARECKVGATPSRLVLVVQYGGYSRRAGALTAVRLAFTIVVHQRLGETAVVF